MKQKVVVTQTGVSHRKTKMQNVMGLLNLDRQKSRMQTVWYCGIRQKEKGVQN